MKKQPESWIDDEGFSKKTYRFLRALVVNYQAKEDLFKFLTNDGKAILASASEMVQLEAKVWLSAQESWMIKKENSRLKEALDIIRKELYDMQCPPAPAPKPESARAKLFLTELNELCRKHMVDIYAEDGPLVITNLDYTGLPYCVNENNVLVDMDDDI